MTGSMSIIGFPSEIAYAVRSLGKLGWQLTGIQALRYENNKNPALNKAVAHFTCKGPYGKGGK